MKVFNLGQARASMTEILNTVTRKDNTEPCYIFSGSRKTVVISLKEYEKMNDRIDSKANSWKTEYELEKSNQQIRIKRSK